MRPSIISRGLQYMLQSKLIKIPHFWFMRHRSSALKTNVSPLAGVCGHGTCFPSRCRCTPLFRGHAISYRSNMKQIEKLIELYINVNYASKLQTLHQTQAEPSDSLCFFLGRRHCSWLRCLFGCMNPNPRNHPCSPRAFHGRTPKFLTSS